MIGFGWLFKLKGERTKRRSRNEIVLDGIDFASVYEARLYTHLIARQARGEINNLSIRPEYNLVVDGVLICRYIAQFSFFEKMERPTRQRVIDICGQRQAQKPEFRMINQLMRAKFNVEIETRI